MNFSQKYRFADWPNSNIPSVSAGVYAIWENDSLIYCGMSGREIEKSVSKSKYGLITRLSSHASGRLSGDQFCVYVANRLVIPKITEEQQPLFASGLLKLDSLTKSYIHTKFEYQYVIVNSSSEAYILEKQCRIGEVFGIKPLLNPL